MKNEKMGYVREKNLIDRTRIKIAVQKSLSRAAIFFSITALFVGIVFAFEGAYFEPVALIKLWVTFFVLGIIMFFRILADSSKWAMGKPFIVKNLIFMPLFLAVSLIFAMDVSRHNEQILPAFPNLLIFALIFLLVFSITQIISYYVIKARTDRMNDALLEFRKEQKWDEEE
ncbi:Protein of unknown function [Butyrivibrio fibrisolvens DSM 3071]|uniref:Uncharacterized protein n=1 Tax=Butyrivibrio fibrisolvens DSM 3071 TaxID=1121131 RepID=A0A1M5ZUC8_BUTFI|nr:DUF3021 family protein [Butyrivibrio fibrisolvens]SHI27871.1 Protein of unknown function [Butyrivibrio fibrisolvens DSM 3071]